jgi:hypothetical protein
VPNPVLFIDKQVLFNVKCSYPENRCKITKELQVMKYCTKVSRGKLPLLEKKAKSRSLNGTDMLYTATPGTTAWIASA